MESEEIDGVSAAECQGEQPLSGKSRSPARTRGFGDRQATQAPGTVADEASWSSWNDVPGW